MRLGPAASNVMRRSNARASNDARSQASSTSDARRSIDQGGAYMGADKTKIESFNQPIKVEDGLLLWVGKKRFCEVRVE